MTEEGVAPVSETTIFLLLAREVQGCGGGVMIIMEERSHLQYTCTGKSVLSLKVA